VRVRTVFQVKPAIEGRVATLIHRAAILVETDQVVGGIDTLARLWIARVDGTRDTVVTVWRFTILAVRRIENARFLPVAGVAIVAASGSIAAVARDHAVHALGQASGNKLYNAVSGRVAAASDADAFIGARLSWSKGSAKEFRARLLGLFVETDAHDSTTGATGIGEDAFTRGWVTRVGGA